MTQKPTIDRRHRCFALSAKGRTCLVAAKPAWQRAQQQLRSAMTPRDWAAMGGAFHSLARAPGHAGAQSVDSIPGRQPV